jgi:hypothetical protein
MTGDLLPFTVFVLSQGFLVGSSKIGTSIIKYPVYFQNHVKQHIKIPSHLSMQKYNR